MKCVTALKNAKEIKNKVYEIYCMVYKQPKGC